MVRQGDSVSVVTRPAIVVLLVLLVLLLSLPLGLGMAMEDCPDCHQPGSGLLDGCLVAVVFVSIALIVAMRSGDLRVGVRAVSGYLLILGLDRPPRLHLA